MPNPLRQKLIARLLDWSNRLYRASEFASAPRPDFRLLVFFHGDSLAHTIRPLVIARALRNRGYRVEFAGRGVHQERIIREGFRVRDIETLPQRRMDEYVARGDYAYYDIAWIDRCVRAERNLIKAVKPDLLIADMRPTLPLSAALEGIDLAQVEAAYNQPGYPFPIPLPESFSVRAGPFDEYLERQDRASRKPHTVLYLVADVPEFHPPGRHTPSYYHYVGPLIDDAPEPRFIPELAGDDWDTHLPLIYLNCGSTGAEPAFLEPVLEDLAAVPCRVLVTTAGRWTGVSPSVNIHLVDFLPAAWVLRRAALFVGIGGIGSIYHALRQGVPILGAPEHLDQEYHLNRVQDLGLGMKLNWEDFHRSGSLLQAVRSLLENYGEYKKRCEAFARYVRIWEGGRAAADVIDRYVLARQGAYRIDADYLLPEADFIHQLELSTPVDLTAPLIRDILREAIPRGLPHVKRDTEVYFDRCDSWNWLYDHDPRFFERDYQALEQKRQAFFRSQEGRLLARRPEQRYRLTYRYRPDRSTWPSEAPAQLFLPYPLTTTYQREVELGPCEPEGLSAYLLPEAGFFYGYPIRADVSETAPLEFAYTCELTVETRSPERASRRLSDREYRRYTQVNPHLDTSAVVEHFYHQIEWDPGLSDYEKARRLYESLVRSKRFKKTQERCQCLGCSTQAILADTGGHCITLSHAFIALCRLQGIPARAVTGALAGYPVEEGRFEMRVYNEALFGHTWAEVFTEAYGWMPVEFHGIVIGAGAMTDENVRDPLLREQIDTQGDRYLEYYFGHLDCHRIVCSHSVKKIPHLLIREQDADGRPSFSVPPGLAYECTLSFECI